MEIKNIVLHFPWGAGGNFIRNCLLLDDRYEFDQLGRNSQERYRYLIDFYQRPTSVSNWLDNEWQGPRGYLYRIYYETPGVQIIHWSAKNNVVYITHCQDNELSSIMNSILLDLKHVFLIPVDCQLISEIYVSKNTVNDRHLPGTTVEKIANTTLYIKYLKENQMMLQEQLKKQNQTYLVYNVDRLFDENGIELVMDIIKDLSMDIPKIMVEHLYQLWIKKTKLLYNDFFYNHPNLSPARSEWK
jgi:hypothetical protein